MNAAKHSTWRIDRRPQNAEAAGYPTRNTPMDTHRATWLLPKVGSGQRDSGPARRPGTVTGAQIGASALSKTTRGMAFSRSARSSFASRSSSSITAPTQRVRRRPEECRVTDPPRPPEMTTAAVTGLVSDEDLARTEGVAAEAFGGRLHCPAGSGFGEFADHFSTVDRDFRIDPSSCLGGGSNSCGVRALLWADGGARRLVGDSRPRRGCVECLLIFKGDEDSKPLR